MLLPEAKWYKELIRLDRNRIARVVETITGHCRLNRYLNKMRLSKTFEWPCRLEEETDIHVICELYKFSQLVLDWLRREGSYDLNDEWEEHKLSPNVCFEIELSLKPKPKLIHLKKCIIKKLVIVKNQLLHDKRLNIQYTQTYGTNIDIVTPFITQVFLLFVIIRDAIFKQKLTCSQNISYLIIQILELDSLHITQGK